MFKNMSLGRKLLTSFASAAAIFTLFVIFMVFLMQSTFSAGAQAVEDAQASQNRLLALERNFFEIRRMASKAASSRNVNDANMATNAVITQLNSMLNDLNALRGLSGPLLPVQQFSAIEQSLNQYRNAIHGFSAEPMQSFLEEIDYFLINVEPNLAANINAAINIGLTRVNLELNALMDYSSFGINAGTIALIAAFLVSAVLLTVVFYMLHKSIVSPAAKLAVLTKNIAQGNFKNLEKYKSGDELGLLSDSLETIIQTLNNLKKLQNDWLYRAQRGEQNEALPTDLFLGEFNEIVSATNSIISGFESELDVITASITRFANGDFSSLSRMRHNSQYISLINEMSASLKTICYDIQNILASSVAGDFKNHMEVGKYNGEWQKIAINVNSLMDSIAMPLTQMKSVLDDAASGKFDKKVTAEAKGDLLKLKVSINNTFTNLTKYLKTITESLREAGGRSRTYLDLPGDLTPIKIALSELHENTALKNSANSTPAPESRTSAVSRSANAGKSKHDGTKRFSGAPSVDSAVIRGKGQPDYTRSDFGKY